jgi:hypothetical protein
LKILGGRMGRLLLWVGRDAHVADLCELKSIIIYSDSCFHRQIKCQIVCIVWTIMSCVTLEALIYRPSWDWCGSVQSQVSELRGDMETWSLGSEWSSHWMETLNSKKAVWLESSTRYPEIPAEHLALEKNT